MKNLTQREFMHHTMNREVTNVSGNVKYGEATMTGHCIKDILISDVITIDKVDYTVVEVLENRNHKGVFEDESKKENSFWKLKTTYQELVDYSK